MGTQAIIKVQDSNVALYKHYDGYPEATLEWLEDFNQKFTEQRGNDPEYKMAQLVRSSIIDAGRYGLDESLTTGWGLMTLEESKDYCVDWEYELLSDGSVKYC